MSKKFFKVYKGPGYPVDPKLEEERQLEQFNPVDFFTGLDKAYVPNLVPTNESSAAYKDAFEQYLAKKKALESADAIELGTAVQEIYIINEDEEDDLNYDMTIIKDYGCKLPPIKEPIFKNL